MLWLLHSKPSNIIPLDNKFQHGRHDAYRYLYTHQYHIPSVQWLRTIPLGVALGSQIFLVRNYSFPDTLYLDTPTYHLRLTSYIHCLPHPGTGLGPLLNFPIVLLNDSNTCFHCTFYIGVHLCISPLSEVRAHVTYFKCMVHIKCS